MNQPHTHQEMDVQKHSYKRHKGKRRQLLGAQYKQPHQTCRQTDDYLHDKDLKYSPQTFSPGALSLLSVYTFSPSELVLTERLFFKGLRDVGFDSTSARKPSFSFKRGRIVVFPTENQPNALQKHTLHLLFSHSVYSHRIRYILHKGQAHRNK